MNPNRTLRHGKEEGAVILLKGSGKLTHYVSGTLPVGISKFGDPAHDPFGCVAVLFAESHQLFSTNETHKSLPIWERYYI